MRASTSRPFQEWLPKRFLVAIDFKKKYDSWVHVLENYEDAVEEKKSELLKKVKEEVGEQLTRITEAKSEKRLKGLSAEQATEEKMLLEVRRRLIDANQPWTWKKGGREFSDTSKQIEEDVKDYIRNTFRDKLKKQTHVRAFKDVHSKNMGKILDDIKVWVELFGPAVKAIDETPKEITPSNEGGSAKGKRTTRVRHNLQPEDHKLWEEYKEVSQKKTQIAHTLHQSEVGEKLLGKPEHMAESLLAEVKAWTDNFKATNEGKSPREDDIPVHIKRDMEVARELSAEGSATAKELFKQNPKTEATEPHVMRSTQQPNAAESTGGSATKTATRSPLEKNYRNERKKLRQKMKAWEDQFENDKGRKPDESDFDGVYLELRATYYEKKKQEKTAAADQGGFLGTPKNRQRERQTPLSASPISPLSLAAST